MNKARDATDRIIANLQFRPTNRGWNSTAKNAIISRLHLPIAPSAPHRGLASKLLRLNGLFALCFVVAVAGFVGWRITRHNEGVVRPGELYRSGQLGGQELARMIQEDGIKTVINLRGANPHSGWYQEETAVCEQLGVEHLDVTWSAKSLPPPGEVAKLLQAYRNAPRPILVHCRSGSDRTGLASALYLINEDHVRFQEASQALTWRYGHFPVYPYFPMDEFLALYHQSGRPTVASWVALEYPAIYAKRSHPTESHEIAESIRYALWGTL